MYPDTIRPVNLNVIYALNFNMLSMAGKHLILSYSTVLCKGNS